MAKHFTIQSIEQLGLKTFFHNKYFKTVYLDVFETACVDDVHVLSGQYMLSQIQMSLFEVVVRGRLLKTTKNNALVKR